MENIICYFLYQHYFFTLYVVGAIITFIICSISAIQERVFFQDFIYIFYIAICWFVIVPAYLYETKIRRG